MIKSLNNKLLCEPYQGGKNIRAEVKSGFASVAQKNSLVPLKLLADAEFSRDGKAHQLPKGATLYFMEEVLTINNQYHNPVKSDLLKEPFVVAEAAHVVAFKVENE
jgi:hypothetical protein